MTPDEQAIDRIANWLERYSYLVNRQFVDDVRRLHAIAVEAMKARNTDSLDKTLDTL